MEVLKFLEQIPLPILVVALVILVAITVVMHISMQRCAAWTASRGMYTS